MSAPIPRRIRGVVRLYPAVVPGRGFTLDPAGRHVWTPLAPIARVEVAMQQPALSWSGAGYLDMNAGSAPLERDFVRWDWSCARTGDGAAVLYDVTPRGASPHCLGLRFDHAGGVAPFEPPPPVGLPRTGWRVARGIRAEDGVAVVRRTFEDTPFYARSEVASHLHGKSVLAMHESLALDRFASPIVQAMLPFRMPRRTGAAPAD